MQLLKIQAHLNHIQLAAIFFTSEVEYDAFLPEYAAIVEMSEGIHPYLSTTLDTNSGEKKVAGGIFRFQSGIVHPLVRNPFPSSSIPVLV
jgi:hypothetical protein